MRDGMHKKCGASYRVALARRDMAEMWAPGHGHMTSSSCPYFSKNGALVSEGENSFCQSSPVIVSSSQKEVTSPSPSKSQTQSSVDPDIVRVAVIQMSCCKGGFITLLSDIIASREILLEWRDKSGRTPLMLVAGRGSILDTKQYVDQGADIHARDRGGHTALWYAQLNHHEEVAKYLLSKGSEIDN
eukprot:gene36579-47665_t